MKELLATIGLTKEELQERVVNKIAEEVLTTESCDEDGHEYRVPSEMRRNLEQAMRDSINDAVSQHAEKYLTPGILAKVEEWNLQQTNTWGEKTGKAVTFTEYILQRAEAWMQEQVDYRGEKPSGYSKGNQTRITYLINSHLQYSISNAIEGALKDFESKCAQGLAETVKLQLSEFAEKLKVEVKR